jgi:hypothetical protein
MGLVGNAGLGCMRVASCTLRASFSFIAAAPWVDVLVDACGAWCRMSNEVRSDSRGWSLVVIVLVAIASGCTTIVYEDPPETVPASNLDDIQKKIFGPICSVPGCHSATLPRKGMSLFNEELTMASTVGVPPDAEYDSAGYPAIIVPGDPDHSFLVRKITGPGPNQGLHMPMNHRPLSNATIDAIRAWIAGMPKATK